MARTRSHSHSRRMHGKRALLLVTILLIFTSSVYATHRFQVRKNAHVMLEAARTAELAGETRESVSLYLRYLNFQPKDSEALAEYAAILDRQLQSQPRVARELSDTYDRLLSIDSSQNEIRKKLVKLYLDSQYYTGARDHLDFLMDPARGKLTGDPELLEEYAICEQKLGRPKEAIERLRQAIESRKATPNAYLRLAEMLRNDRLSQSALEEADRVVDQLKEDRPTDVTARIGRAQYLFQQGKLAEGRTELEAAALQLKDAASNPDLVSLLAEVYLKDNNPKAARDLLARALASTPNDPRLYVLNSEALSRLNEKARSDEQLREAMKKTPDADPRGLDLVDWMIDRGDYVNARTEVERRFASRKAEFEPVYRYLNGRLRLAEGNWPAAVTELQAARPAFARLPRYHAKLLTQLGDAYLIGDNPDQAAELFAEAVRRFPTATEAELKLAEVQARLGKASEAQETFRKYADLPRVRAMYSRQVFAVLMGRPAGQRDWATLEKAIGKPPYSSEIELVRVVAADAQGKNDDAKKILSEAMTRHPEDLPLRLAAAAMAGRAEPREGVKVIDKAIKDLGDKTTFRLAKMGYLGRAGADVSEITALGENSAAFPREERFQLYFGLGELLLTGMKKATPAAEWLRKAADLNSFDIPSRSFLIEALIQANRDAEVEKVIAELAPLEGAEGPHALFARAIHTLARAKPDDREKMQVARQQLEQVVAKRESWAKPQMLLAQLAERAGTADVAIERYRKAYELGERTDLVVRSLVNLLMNRGRFPEAIRLLQERERNGRLSDDERQQMAYAEMLSGRKGSAEGTAAVKLAANSKEPRDQLFRGRMLLLENKIPQAIEALEKATSYGPGLPDAWMELVNAYLLAGNTTAAKVAAAKAEKSLRAEKSLVPAQVRLTLGRIQTLLNQFPAAESLFLEALIMAPNDPEPHIQLAQLYRAVGKVELADKECQAIVDATAPPSPPSVRRWARRTLAYSLLTRPDGFRNLPKALALVDANLKEIDSAEDKRAKAIVLSIDPTRRADTKFLLEKAQGVPATTEENIRIGLLYEQEANYEAAEQAYKEATSGPMATPEHLEMLFRVQFARGRSGQETLDRLKALAPGSWSTAVAEARQLAKRDKPGAVKRLEEYPQASDPAVRIRQIVPLLLDLGCKDQAETMLKEVAEKSKLPQREAPYISMLARNGKWAEAFDRIQKLPVPEYPVALQARLYRETFGSTPRLVVTDKKRAEWDAAFTRATTWITEQSTANPKDPLYLTVLGVLADAQGRYADAIKLFEKSLAIAPDQPDVRNNLANLLILTNAGPVVPLDLVTGAIETTGPTPYLLDTRAMIYLNAGKTQEAIADLTAALLVQQKPIYFFHLALVNEKMGNVGLKIEFIDKALKKGLKRAQLHPKEWPEYDRLFGPEA